MFLLRKKLEGMLNYAFPQKWIPLYKMVTFTRIPYDKVIELEKKQVKRVGKLAVGVTQLRPQANILEKSSYVAAILVSTGLLWAAKTFLRSSL